jgi:hypothetical protein
LRTSPQWELAIWPPCTLFKFACVAGALNCAITSIVAFGFDVGRSGAVRLLEPAFAATVVMLLPLKTFFKSG